MSVAIVDRPLSDLVAPLKVFRPPAKRRFLTAKKAEALTESI
jgi:hypothetical protein